MSSVFGFDLFGEPILPPSRGKMADDFTCPPFSVLSSREGWWQERKAAWLAYGIKSEVGRVNAGNERTASLKSGTTWGCSLGAYDGKRQGTSEQGTSVFDPVLTELCYRWFCPPGGVILDPFAGGSVRGVVAGILRRRYHGVELRPEQVAANEAQRDEIRPDVAPEWVCGDAAEALPSAPEADMVFSCPPYFDLEKYSDNPRDLSAMAWPDFLIAYRRIIALCAAKLRPGRFACFVVGDVRDKRGMYRNLPGETVRAFGDAGMPLYNEAVLVTPVGSLPIRVRTQFVTSRKLGKTHQNVLVFVKGCPRVAAGLMEKAADGR